MGEGQTFQTDMSQNLRVEEERSKDKTLMKVYLHLRRQGRKLKQNSEGIFRDLGEANVQR